MTEKNYKTVLCRKGLRRSAFLCRESVTKVQIIWTEFLHNLMANQSSYCETYTSAVSRCARVFRNVSSDGPMVRRISDTTDAHLCVTHELVNSVKQFGQIDGLF